MAKKVIGQVKLQGSNPALEIPLQFRFQVLKRFPLVADRQDTKSFCSQFPGKVPAYSR